MYFPVLLPNIFNHPFTYQSKLKLKAGEYVRVPFGKSMMTGVVWDCFEKKNNKKFNIKHIFKKIDIEPLKFETIKFLNWFAEYNLVPKGMCLKQHLLSGEGIFLLDKKEYEKYNKLERKSFLKDKNVFSPLYISVIFLKYSSGG